MKTRSSFLFAVILCLAVMLAGCGGANNSSVQSSESPAKANNQESAPDEAGGSNDKAFTIRVGSWFLDDRPHQQELMRMVEEKYKAIYPNAKIQWDITLSSAYFDKLKAQFASDSAPDVVFYQGNDFAKNDLLMDLTNEPIASRIKDASKKTAAVMNDGKLRGVPLLAAISGGVWYNKDLFAQLGIQPPKTVQEFMDINEKIKAAGKTPIVLGFKDQWTISVVTNDWIQSYGMAVNPNFGKEIYDGTRKLDDPAIVSVMENVQLMKEKGYFNKDALSIDWPQSSQAFSSGEAAMILQGSFMPGTHAENVAKNGYANFQIGFFPFMNGQGQFALTVSSSSNLGINAKTQLVQESKDLLDVLTSADIQAPWLKGEGANSAFKDITVQFDDPVMEEIQQYLDEGVVLSYRISNFIPTSSLNALNDIVTKIVSGISFKPEDFQPAMSALERDKATVALPPQ